jgi:pSer/pThr/pTyr-binding forkhead associated (FHA) protein
VEELTCPACQHPHRAEDKYCKKCGAPLPRRKREAVDDGTQAVPTPPTSGESAAVEDEGDPFAEAISVVVSPSDGRRITLHPGDRLVIGRHPDSPLSSVCSDNVSCRHAEIFIDRSVAYLLDTDSMNGTFVDGRRIAPRTPYELQPISTVQLGADPPMNLAIEVRKAG